MWEGLISESLEMREKSVVSEDLRQLSSGLVRGDESAWMMFFMTYQPRLRAYLATCMNEQLANLDDVLQECLIRVARNIRVFDNEEVFWSWLTVLARSAMVDQSRRKSAWAKFLDRYRKHTNLLVDSRPELGPRLEQALEMLGAEERKLLEDKYENGFTVRELAEREKCTEKSMERRLARVRKSLSKSLKKIEKD